MNTTIMSFLNKEDIKEILKEAIREEKEAEPPTPIQPEEDLLSRKQASELLKVTKPTLWAWTKEGRITAYRINSRVYYKRNELLASLNEILSHKNKRR
ncbi:MAG: helix-turn-helix domain-containing protein [Ferruginibacter sp.]